MNVVTIHQSGNGADKLQIVSHGNGLAYAVYFGEAGGPMSNLFLQGDDATSLRDDFDRMEDQHQETDTREVWFSVLDGFLP